ncbi:MAG: cytochrome oxidase subunit III [Bacteroidetes bacterium]|nr:cytochrome oxidase subunit III [Bacteroidota bacterium]
MAGEASKAIDKSVLWGGGRSPFSVSYGKMMMWFFLISDALTFGGFLSALAFQRHHLEDIWPITEEIFFHFPFTHAHLPLLYVAFMTFVLIISSVTMVLAVEAGHRMDRRKVIIWLGLTVVGGAIFLGSQAWEWSTFIAGSENGAYVLDDGTMGRLDVDHDTHQEFLTNLHSGDVIDDPATVAAIKENNTLVNGANLEQNEYGPQLYANFFFFITGFHGSHVFSGVLLNLIVLIRCIQGWYDKRGHYEMVEKVGLYWHFVDLVWVFVFTFFYLI